MVKIKWLYLLCLSVLLLLSCIEETKIGEESVSKFTNKLIEETSPYLLQHAHNPVNWYPWGDEAFSMAKKLDRPVFLSIGYSACHWCHVMEHESFENESIAEIMNENFINIKVDREERPDIDQLYMEYVQMTTGSGGWPMSIFMTPAQQPFFGGTYFPPIDKYGRPGFERILKAMADYYTNEKEKLLKNIAQVTQAYEQIEKSEKQEREIPDRQDWWQATDRLAKLYEPVNGGIGSAPKFPAVSVFSLFLRAYKIGGEPQYLNMVTHTLTKMANGGIYDQIGGGFARYSVDDQWLVPHFEKMLYDNGQLVQLYLDTYLTTGEVFYLNIAEEILSFVQREMLSAEGGFYSSLDADSEGEEGKFYVWEKKEIEEVLGKDADIFMHTFDVTEKGNFESKNILNRRSTLKETAKYFDQEEIEINKIIDNAKEALLEVRNKRIRPATDDKIISSWNGLMLSAYARAYQITRKEIYKNIILKNYALFKNRLINNGRLARTYKNNIIKYDGFIEDYAFVIQAFLDCYEGLFDADFLTIAMELAHYANAHFWDKDHAGYFTISDEQEQLIKKMKDAFDSSTPSATSIMLQNNLRLFYFSGENQLYQYAEEIIKMFGVSFRDNPYSYASYLAGLDLYLEKPQEIIIVKNQQQQIDDFLQLILNSYFPNKMLIVLSGEDNNQFLSLPLIANKKPLDGKVTVYVCHNFSCSLPIHSPAGLKKLLSD